MSTDFASPAATAKRRTQAERTQLTQRKLLRGAIELLKKKRYAGFRIAEVAELAGVSKGAQTHHIASKDVLVLQALEEVYRDTQARALERVARARHEPSRAIELLAEDSETFFLGDDFLMSLDLLMVNPESALGTAVKALAMRYRLPVEQAWVDALVEVGHSAHRSLEVVRLTYAIARGFGIRQLMSGSTDEIPRLMAAWRATAEAILSPAPARIGTGTPTGDSADDVRKRSTASDAAGLQGIDSRGGR